MKDKERIKRFNDEVEQLKESVLLSKRPDTSSTWECFTKAEKQKKSNA